MKGKQPPKKVIVLGAGLAGLAAAYELTEAGHDVTVLEAQMRAGGRVFTIRDAFADGIYAEAGAAGFIPVEPDPLLRYAKRFNLPLAEPEPRTFPFLYFFHGKRIEETHFSQVAFPLNLTAEEKKLGLTGMRTKYLKSAVDEIIAACQAGDLSGVFEKYDRHSFGELMRSHGASPDAIRLLAIVDWDFVDENLDNHSALDVLAQTAVYSVFTGPRYSIEGGNDILPKTFAAALGARVRYGAAAVRIARRGDAVQLGYLQGGIMHSLSADYLVCTIPFSVLRGLEISPPFSAGKRRAIEELAYASVSRIFIQSRHRFWIDQGLSGYAFTDLPVTFMWDAAAGQRSTRGVLQALMTGPAARRFAALGEEARMRFILHEAEKVYPQIREYAEGGVAKCWDDDPWSRGAYTWFKPGQMAALLPHLATPEGRVHFAGEHTASLLLRGLVQGALESGIRAAQEISEAT